MRLLKPGVKKLEKFEIRFLSWGNVDGPYEPLKQYYTVRFKWHIQIDLNYEKENDKTITCITLTSVCHHELSDGLVVGKSIASRLMNTL